jgi:hypothetical protein
MNGSWWVFPAMVSVVAVLSWLIWPVLRKRRNAFRLKRACRQFHMRREWLEADFQTMAATSGKPRGLTWREIDFADEAVFATDRNTNELRAFVAVTIAFDAVEGGDMEDNPNVESDRVATAVFLFDGRHWHTEGRAIFNLYPLEAIERFQQQLELVE